MNVALIQLNAGPDKARNVGRALEMAEEAVSKGAQFVLLPEVFHYRGPVSPETMRLVAERIPGESTRPFMDLARRRKVPILAGSVFEKSRDPRRAYNASALIGPSGKISAVYRKIHLFDANLGTTTIRESARFVAGRRRVSSRVGDFRIGQTVCFDLRFPDLYRAYAQSGCHVLCAPSAFTRKTGQAHWEVLVRSRAIENLCYVLAPNQAGQDAQGVETYGNSMIVSPWGEVLARGSLDKEEIVSAEISLAAVAEARRVLPVFNFGKK